MEQFEYFKYQIDDRSRAADLAVRGVHIGHAIPEVASARIDF